MLARGDVDFELTDTHLSRLGADDLQGGSGGDRLDLSAVEAGVSLAGLQTSLALSKGTVYSGSFGVAGALCFDITTHTQYGKADAGKAVDFAIQLTG